MIEIIEGIPDQVAGFRATGVVSSKDYHTVINPRVKQVVTSYHKIPYLMVLNTPLKNYTLGAWIEDGLLGLRYFSKWKKLAIVTHASRIKKFTDTFGFLIPCPAKGFSVEDLDAAIKWVSED
ncbi:MAG: STAS/SEC14 domain-containing protein [Bacteroidota bacterium]|nr:STAS/SEC14 domain-containing protein [Bacteroidota bacterium]